MVQSINGTLITVDSYGVTLQGSLLGSTQSQLEFLNEQDYLRIFSKRVYVFEPISKLSSNEFYLPAVYGKNLVFIFLNGRCFFPGKDFTVTGARVKWENSNYSLNQEDQIVAFGPANTYTAECFTVENIILNSSNYDPSDSENSDLPTIQLNNSFATSKKPYDQKSIFVFINHKLYSPEKDFIYDVFNNKLVWQESSSMELSLGLKIDIFYYNKVQTSPYMLGDLLYRTNLTAAEAEQDAFDLAAIPFSSFIDSAAVFYEGLRSNYRDDFKINFPQLQITESGNLLQKIESSGILDVAYFCRAGISNTISALNFYYNGDSVPSYDVFELVESGVTYQFPMPTFGDSISINKTFLFFRGLLCIHRYYDNVNLNDPGSLSFPNSNQKWEWERITVAGPSVSYKLKWNAQARKGIPGAVPETDPLIPSTAFNDFFTWTAFTDQISKDSIKVEYFQRSGSSTIVTTQEMAAKKCIVWYNGQALFQEFGDFTVDNTDKRTITFNTYPVVPVTLIDEIVVMYFTSESYAALWKFDGVIVTSNTPAETAITFSTAINALQSSFLFNNGLRIDNKDYEAAETTNAIKINEAVTAGNKLMLVHT